MAAIDDDASLWSCPPSEPDDRPLLVLLHGRGGDEHDMERFFPQLPSGYAAVSLRAPRPHGERFSWLAPIHDEDSLSAALDGAALELLRWIDAHRGNAEHVGLIGWSQGGAVALQALRLAPTSFACVVTLGALPEEAIGQTTASSPDCARPSSGDAAPVTMSFRHPTSNGWRPSSPHHTTLTAEEYEGVGHEISPAEWADVLAFIDAWSPTSSVE
ncbi:alpha/beta hydrolase [Paramicrobacterium humi]|nr:alpha/beta fold hydrolase [Microbacterium humi]